MTLIDRGSMADGGVVALSGFRYQMLHAIEEILVLHGDDPGGDWAVEVEHATSDKVDYAVYRLGQLTRAVQVKASRAASSTRLSLNGKDGVATILAGLSAALPSAPEVALVSNRQGPWEAIHRWVAANQPSNGPRMLAVQESRTLDQLEQSVADLLRVGRIVGGLPSDPSTIVALAALLEARLWRLASKELVNTLQGRRWLGGADVKEILGLRDQELAAALGELSWAMRWKEPAGRAIARPSALSFLAYELSSTDLAERRVRRAALTGFGGLGKSMAAAAWADENQGRYSMVLWLTATNPDAIEADARQLLAAEHGVDAATWTVPEVQRRLRAWLQTTPRSWLLILDDAASVEVVEGWIPTGGFGHVLITSRDAAWPISHAPSFEVGPLEDGEIRELVALRLGVEEVPRADLLQLISLTDRWALAVDMVLAWLARHRHALADLSAFDPRESRQQLLDDPGLAPVGYPEPVMVVILDALASLAAEQPEAWALLQATVALGSDAVPVAMASDHIADSLLDLARRDRLVAELRNRSVASPMSVGDPRLGQWGHRLNVHDLISQVVASLDPIGETRWVVLLDRLVSVVEQAAEQHQFVLVLSFGPVVETVDRAIRNGAPFTIGYLTLLGNTAAVLAAAGRLHEAARRLEAERALAEAQSASLTRVEGRPLEWFGLLATLQLATVLNRLDQPGDALSLLEEAVPKISGFHGEVNPDKLSNALELAEDVLESVRIPELYSRRDTLLAAARCGTVQASRSPLRAAEACLRLDDLAGARSICDEALASQPSPLVQMDLYGKLAESWAVDDITRSDDLLRLAQITAHAEELDPEQPLDDLQNTVRRRIVHLVAMDPVELHCDLPQYRSWFDVQRLMPPAEQCRTWRQSTLADLSLAWRQLTEQRQDATRAISTVNTRFRQVPRSVSPSELVALRYLLWGTQFTSACSSFERLETIAKVGRKGSEIFIEVSHETWQQVPELLVGSLLSATPLLVGHRFGPWILVGVGTRGLIVNAADFDPFARVDGEATIFLARSGAFDVNSREVDAGGILELGTVADLQPDEDWAAFVREREAARDGDSD